METPRKREVAHKLRIGQILNGNPIIEQQQSGITDGGVKEMFRFLEYGDKQIKRVNVVANVIDKFASEGEKRFASLTVDDATGQIRIKVFGEDVALFDDVNQGDTILIIGLLRSYNNELYVLPEVIKKQDPRYLLVRKLETEGTEQPMQLSTPSPQASPPTPQETTPTAQPVENTPQPTTNQTEPVSQEAQAPQTPTEPTTTPIREKIVALIKSGENDEGIDVEQIILQLKDITPDEINKEVTKLLEDGIIYEPRPGRVRYLG